MKFLGMLLLMAGALCADVTGRYSGTWTSDATGGGGKIEMSFEPGASGEWNSTSSFTYQGQEVRTKTVSSKVTGDQIEVIFEYDIDGLTLRSKMLGSLSGSTIKGKYVSSSTSDNSQVDAGAWEATRK